MKKLINQMSKTSHEQIMVRLKHLRGEHDQRTHAWNRGMGQGGYGAGLAPNQMGPLPTQSFYRQRLADLTAQRRRGEITRAEMRQQMNDLRGITRDSQDVTSTLVLGNAPPTSLVNNTNTLFTNSQPNVFPLLQGIKQMRQSIIQKQREAVNFLKIADALHLDLRNAHNGEAQSSAFYHNLSFSRNLQNGFSFIDMEIRNNIDMPINDLFNFIISSNNFPIDSQTRNLITQMVSQSTFDYSFVSSFLNQNRANISTFLDNIAQTSQTQSEARKASKIKDALYRPLTINDKMMGKRNSYGNTYFNLLQNPQFVSTLSQYQQGFDAPGYVLHFDNTAQKIAENVDILSETWVATYDKDALIGQERSLMIQMSDEMVQCEKILSSAKYKDSQYSKLMNDFVKIRKQRIEMKKNLYNTMQQLQQLEDSKPLISSTLHKWRIDNLKAKVAQINQQYEQVFQLENQKNFEFRDMIKKIANSDPQYSPLNQSVINQLPINALDQSFSDIQLTRNVMAQTQATLVPGARKNKNLVSQFYLSIMDALKHDNPLSYIQMPNIAAAFPALSAQEHNLIESTIKSTLEMFPNILHFNSPLKPSLSFNLAETKDRSSWNESTLTMELTNADTSSVIVHETMHMLQTMFPELYLLTEHFLVSRVSNDPLGPVHLMAYQPNANYDKDEWGFNDATFHPYVFKYYPKDDVEFVEMENSILPSVNDMLTRPEQFKEIHTMGMTDLTHLYSNTDKEVFLNTLLAIIQMPLDDSTLAILVPEMIQLLHP